MTWPTGLTGTAAFKRPPPLGKGLGTVNPWLVSRVLVFWTLRLLAHPLLPLALVPTVANGQVEGGMILCCRGAYLGGWQVRASLWGALFQSCPPIAGTTLVPGRLRRLPWPRTPTYLLLHFVSGAEALDPWVRLGLGSGTTLLSALSFYSDWGCGGRGAYT